MAALLVLALAPTATANSGPSVTFSSQPAAATLVAHYTVTPAQRAQAQAGSHASSAAINELPELSPKENPNGAQAAARNAARSSAAATASGMSPLRDSGDRVPPLSASFIGQQASNVTCSYFPHGCNPPDMAVAASTRDVLQGVNTQWEVFTPSGTPKAGWPVSAQSFFGVPSNTCDPAANGQPFLSDPRAIYDASTGRFWAAMLQLEGALGVGGACPLKTVYYIAVSQTSNPSGAWNVYEFDMSLGTTNVADYTQIGLNNDAVYFSANMFTQDGSAYAYAEIFEANKWLMMAGHGLTADGFFNLQAHGPGGDFLADTVQPVNNINHGDFGPALFVDTLDGPDPVNGHFCGNMTTDACSGLAVWHMSNPTAHDFGGPAPTLTGTYAPTKPFAFPPAADQPGCTQCIDANDLRIPGTPVYKDGTIYTGWGTAFNNGTQIVPVIEWAQVHAGFHEAESTTGYYGFGGDTAATYPAFMTHEGTVLMVYERMGSTMNPEARYTTKSIGGHAYANPGRLLKAGEAPYRPGLCGTSALPTCRWGDYEAASWNGASRIYFAGQYANSFTDPNAAPVFGRNWGTWIGAITAH